VALASRQLKKLAPPDKEKPIVEKAIKELQEGAPSSVERQKHICFVDQKENGWDAVAEQMIMRTTEGWTCQKERKTALNGQRPKRSAAQRDYGYPGGMMSMAHLREATWNILSFKGMAHLTTIRYLPQG